MLDAVPRSRFFARRNPTAHRNSMRELLDGELLPAELSRNLREIRLINHGLGWTADTLRVIDRVAREIDSKTFTCLDVATGSGDLPLALLRHAGRRHWSVDIHALDASAAVLDVAARHIGNAPVRLHAGDARALPFDDQSFDVVTCVLSLHHFPPDEAVLVVSELARVARRAWVVVDLERCFPAYVGALALRLLLRSQITRHDAPVSVLRAYTLPEFRQLLVRAGLDTAVSGTRFPFRLVAHGLAAAEIEP
jgi:SAM-dependent methyltransferase